MPKMPTLGPQPRKSSGGKLLGPLVIAAIGVGGYRYYKQHQVELTQTPAAQTASAEVTASAGAQAPGSAAPGAQPMPGAQPLPGAAAPTAPGATGATPPGAQAIVNSATAEAARPAAPQGPRAVSFTLNGALETSLAAKVGNDIAPALAQVLTRTLVWWVEVPNELMRGDQIDLVFNPDVDGEPQVEAVRLVSHKYDKTFSAYRFKAEGDAYSRLYEPDGFLLEKHLVHPPLDAYEQVTSLLRDGRHHKGVDFKTPVGTPVNAPFTGTIVRKNWNWRGNGNCLDLEESAAPHRHAFFLHLSPIPDSVKVGMHVTRGQRLAETGNTGHSFAPHLHYQLMASNGTKVLDPFEQMKTQRIAISASQKAALTQAIAKFGTLMGPAVVSAAAK